MGIATFMVPDQASNLIGSSIGGSIGWMLHDEIQEMIERSYLLGWGKRVKRMSVRNLRKHLRKFDGCLRNDIEQIIKLEIASRIANEERRLFKRIARRAARKSGGVVQQSKRRL